MGGGGRLIFASGRLWLVTERSGKVVISLYDLVRQAAFLVWFVGERIIAQGGVPFQMSCLLLRGLGSRELVGAHSVYKGAGAVCFCSGCLIVLY